MIKFVKMKKSIGSSRRKFERCVNLAFILQFDAKLQLDPIRLAVLIA
jgi:hypothetical protein